MKKNLGNNQNEEYEKVIPRSNTSQNHWVGFSEKEFKQSYREHVSQCSDCGEGQ